MRLFVALDLPAATVSLLEDLLARLRPLAAIHWSPPANLHITIKFIGEWPETRLSELKSALEAVARPAPFSVRIAGLGFFPNPHAPRVFWCGIEAPSLAQLAAATESAATSLGIPAERRPFSPHLTLARIKERTGLQPLQRSIAGLGPFDCGAFQPSSFFLYRSALGPAGSVYTKLAEFPLL